MPVEMNYSMMNTSSQNKPESAAGTESVAAMEAFTTTRKVFTELEAAGISDFQIFNALSDLFHQRGEPEISELMAEAAYRCFQKD
jgi:hypothetical protein